MATRQPGMSREQSAEETRQALLDAGAALLKDEPVGKALSQVQAQEVARRAGVTAGAFYHYWRTQHEYVDELLAYVLSPDRLPNSDLIEAAVREATEQGASLEEVVRTGAATAFKLVKRDKYLPVQMALWGKRDTTPGVRERISAHYQGLQKRYVALVKYLLKANNLKMRPPFTPETAAATLMALSEGMFIRWSVDPEAIPGDLPGPPVASSGSAKEEFDREPWDLFAAVVLALVPTMTMPIEKCRDRCDLLQDGDVHQLVRSLYEIRVSSGLEKRFQRNTTEISMASGS